MPMTIQLPSGHRFRTDNARAIKLIEAGAVQVEDDQTLEIAVAPSDEIETTEAPKPRPAKKRAPAKKAAAKD